jgi:hypothetical protein
VNDASLLLGVRGAAYGCERASVLLGVRGGEYVLLSERCLLILGCT